MPPHYWKGRHDLRAGLDLDHIGFDESVSQAPVSYLREDRTLLRRSVFSEVAPFTGHNVETGAYFRIAGWRIRACLSSLACALTGTKSCGAHYSRPASLPRIRRKKTLNCRREWGSI